MIKKANTPEEDVIALLEDPPDYKIYGEEYIEDGAKEQIEKGLVEIEFAE